MVEIQIRYQIFLSLSTIQKFNDFLPKELYNSVKATGITPKHKQLVGLDCFLFIQTGCL
jgi:hypothetical protein